MRKLAIFTWAISAGIVGIVAGFALSIHLGLEKPELSYLVAATAVAFGAATGYFASVSARSTRPGVMTVFAVLGVLATVATQALYWGFLIH